MAGYGDFTYDPVTPYTTDQPEHPQNILRVRNEVSNLIDAGTSSDKIRKYIESNGLTVEQVRNEPGFRDDTLYPKPYGHEYALPAEVGRRDLTSKEAFQTRLRDIGPPKKLADVEAYRALTNHPRVVDSLYPEDVGMGILGIGGAERGVKQATKLGARALLREPVASGALGGVLGAAAGSQVGRLAQSAEDLYDFPGIRKEWATPTWDRTKQAIGDTLGDLNSQAKWEIGMRSINPLLTPSLKLLGRVLKLNEYDPNNPQGMWNKFKDWWTGGHARYRPTEAVKEMKDTTFRAGLSGSEGSYKPIYDPKLKRIVGLEHVPPITNAKEGASPVLADTGGTRMISKVLGTPPILGGPIRKAMDTNYRRLGSLAEDYVNQISPKTELHELGTEMEKGFRSTIASRRAGLRANYDKAEEMLKQVGNPAVIPTEDVRAVAQKELSTLDELPKTERVEQVLPTGRKDAKGRPIYRHRTIEGERTGVSNLASQGEGNTFEERLRKIANLSPYATFSELRALEKDIRTAMEEATSKGDSNANNYGRILGEIQYATKNAFDKIDVQSMPEKYRNLLDPRLNDETFQPIKDQFRHANSEFRNYMTDVERQATRGMTKVDKTAFIPGLPDKGMDPEMLAVDYLRGKELLRNPQYLKDLRGWIGDKTFNKFARTVVLDAMDASDEYVSRITNQRVFVFDPTKLKDTLGMTRMGERVGDVSARGGEDAARELLRTSGVDYDTLRNLADAAERTFSVGDKIVDPSTFLTRRITMSGNASVLPRGFSIGKRIEEARGEGFSVVTALFKGITIIGSAVRVSNMLSSEKGLRLLTEGMRAKPTRQNMALLAVRLTKAMGSKLEDDAQDHIQYEAAPFKLEGEDRWRVLVYPTGLRHTKPTNYGYFSPQRENAAARKQSDTEQGIDYLNTSP